MPRWLTQQAHADMDIDGDGRLDAHRAALAAKPMLQGVFQDFHRQFVTLDHRYFGTTAGRTIELGAGVCPVRESFPDVEASDVVSTPHLDLVLDAQAMDLPAASVRALYLQNCFHHFPEPAKFFAEASRVVVQGGGIVMIEPFHGPVASLLYPRLFASEGFDKAMAGWHAPIDGPMRGANQALSYVVFVRDRALWQSRFPAWEIVTMSPLGNYPRYIASGGLNFRKLLPDAAARPLQVLERILAPLSGILALHHVIVLRRR